jgi:hypothetical protein
MQEVPFVGPLPVGLYTIGGAYTHPKLGPITMDLIPDPSNVMYNRDDFRMHGFAAANPKGSSDGCIVQEEDVRVLISRSPDKRLQVVAVLPPADAAPVVPGPDPDPFV